MSEPPWEQLDERAWMRVAQLSELGVLSASLLHELRQPLFAIKAIAQMGQADGGMAPERVDWLVEQVEQLQRIVEAYTDLGGGSEVELVFDLNEPVRGALDLATFRGRAAAAALGAELSGEVRVRARRGAVRQIALNLLVNALDAVEGDHAGRVVVRTENGGATARLIVEDSGPGLPDEVRARLFQPFVTTKPPGRGTGLGLYIAHKLAGEAGGTLVVEDASSGGTRVIVELPAG